MHGAGWMTFDPTPSGPGGPARPSAWNRVRQMFDTVELAWFKWVIEYDLGKQTDAFNSLRNWGSNGARSEASRSIWDTLRIHKTGFGTVVFGLGGLYLWSTRRRRRRTVVRAPRAVAAHHAFERALKALERRGFPRGVAETGRELASRVGAAGDPGAPSFAYLVELEQLAQKVVRPQVRPPQPRADAN